ncbi:TonB-dependent receptor domain-containing protein [Sphingobacterium spiritivorum]|uniref:TonB-dependent receptor domain-containing protein n=1 Tax=Sphingobacterium spiritivorum TaxID=258 RepID=UPI003DA4933F
MEGIYKKLRFSNFSRALLLLVMIHLIISAQAQSRVFSVRGHVITNDSRPLSYATIQLKDTRFGTAVREDGTFTIDAPAGNYRLQIKYAGFVVYEKDIRIINSTSDMGDIVVSVNSHELKEVIVADIERNKFAKKETEGIARMPLANLQNPQVYSVTTKELMQEIGAIDYNTAMSQVPGVVVMNGVNDNGDEVYLRGFAASTTMRNGLPSIARTQSEIFNLERVEVIKGPSATLFGAQATSYGGVVNNVTKRPFESFRGEVSYSTGSWNLNRLTADVNTPLNKERTALLRVNAMGVTQNGFQDAGKQQAYGLAVSLLFKPNERTTVRLDADMYKPQKTLVAYARNTEVLSYGSMDKVPLPYSRSLLTDDITTSRSNMNVSAELEYKISDHWVSRTVYQQNNTGDKGSIFFVPTYLDDKRIQRRYRIFDDYSVNYNTIQQNFSGDYTIGSVRNSIVAGMDVSVNRNSDLSMAPVFATYDIVGITDEVWKPVTKAEIEKARSTGSTGDNRSTSGYNNYSAYVSNVTNISDQLFVMLSLRADRYQAMKSTSYTPPRTTVENGQTVQIPYKYVETDGYGQTFFSPKFGIVYQPVKNQVSVFANYMNSFSNMAASLGLPNDQDLNREPVMMKWKPEKANQFEAGMKFEMLAGKINSTISYYNIQVKDMLRDILGDGTYVQDGTQRSSGLDFDFIANPVKGWNIILGYGYNDNKYIKSDEETQGKRMTWSPKNVANFWTSYKLLSGSIKGLGVGAGVNYVDKVYLDLDEKFYIPSYIKLNATAFYDQPKYRVGFKFNNITNQKHWDFYGKPQKPFEFLANLSFKF